MTRAAELLKAIVDDPDDVASYLVYADVLQGEGDPRGELIALQHAAEQSGDDVIRQRAADGRQELFRMHRARFLSDELADAVTHAWNHGERGKAGLQLGWRWGFIERAWLGRQPGGLMTEACAVLADLLAHPSARVLRELVLDLPIAERWVEFSRLVAGLVATAVPPPLRRLQLGDFVDRDPGQPRLPERDISAVELGDLGAVWSRYARLEAIELQGCHLELGSIELPALRSFELCSSTCSDENLAALTSARWPRLERLVIWLGDGEYGGGVTLDALEQLLRAPNPNLVELGILNTVHSDDVARLLSRLPIARQLHTLDLSLGTLTDAGSRALHPGAFPRLQEVRVQRSYLDPGSIAELVEWHPRVHAEYQRDPDGNRFVAVSE